MLESMYTEKYSSRTIYIIIPDENKSEFMLGRGQNATLQHNDISISRGHANISFTDGKWMLNDNTSKFGTLVLVKQNCPLIQGYSKSVQIGRTILNCSLKSIKPATPKKLNIKVKKISVNDKHTPTPSTTSRVTRRKAIAKR